MNFLQQRANERSTYEELLLTTASLGLSADKMAALENVYTAVVEAWEPLAVVVAAVVGLLAVLRAEKPKLVTVTKASEVILTPNSANGETDDSTI